MDVLFFIVAKVVGILARPETWLLVLMAVGFAAALAGRRHLALWTGVPGIALSLAVALYPIGRPLFWPLEGRFPATPEVVAPVGIVVLGGGEELGPDGAPPQLNHAGERYLAALDLAQRFPDAYVMFTGGRATIQLGEGENADHAAQVFALGGVAPERIVLEKLSRNTVENAVNGLALRPEGTEAGPWIFVTSAWHMPRAVGTFCAAGWEGLVPWPVDYRGHQGTLRWRFAEHLFLLNIVMKEWVGLVGYRVTGRSDGLLPAGCPPSE